MIDRQPFIQAGFSPSQTDLLVYHLERIERIMRGPAQPLAGGTDQQLLIDFPAHIEIPERASLMHIARDAVTSAIGKSGAVVREADQP